MIYEIGNTHKLNNLSKHLTHFSGLEMINF